MTFHFQNFCKITLLVAGLTTVPVASAQNNTPTVQPQKVVELFTSQGCSSCPKANDFVTALANDTDKLVLSYGVTYWDYLGWKDTFAAPEFTERQRDYGQAFGSANIYTPQIVLNGVEHSPRFTHKDIDITRPLPAVSHAELTPSKDGLVLNLDTKLAASDLKIVVVEFTPGPQSIPVHKGENRGRTLTVSNVVTHISPINSLGQEHIFTHIMPQTGQHYAALIHHARTAEILSAAVYKP